MRAFWEQFRGGFIAQVREEFEQKFGADLFGALVHLGFLREGDESLRYPADGDRGRDCYLNVGECPPGVYGGPYFGDPVCDCCDPRVLQAWQVSEWDAEMMAIFRCLRRLYDVRYRAYPQQGPDVFKCLGDRGSGAGLSDVIWMPELTHETSLQLVNRHLDGIRTLALVCCRPLDVSRDALRTLESSEVVSLEFLSETLVLEDGEVMRRMLDAERIVEPGAFEFECLMRGEDGHLEIVPTTRDDCDRYRVRRHEFGTYIDLLSGSATQGVAGFRDGDGKFQQLPNVPMRRLEACAQIIEADGAEVPLRKLKSLADVALANRRWHVSEGRKTCDFKKPGTKSSWRSFREPSPGVFVFEPPEGVTYLVIRRGTLPH